jgi:phage gp36-like protein
MPQYMTVSEFRERTRLPGDFVDEVEARSPGFIDANLSDHSAYVDALLGKRYVVPFSSPYPIAVRRWLTALTSLDVWLRRGVAATDQEMEIFRSQYDTAIVELKEAANSRDGLFELPLRENTDATGISKQYPKTYTENSPFVWKRVQVTAGRQQDINGRGWRR